MKIFRIILFIVLITMPVIMHSQTRLPESSKRSANSYVYTIGRDNLRKIYLKDKEASEDMLGEYVTDIPGKDTWPDLPRGNYMMAYAVDDKLNFTDHTIDNLYYMVAPSEKLMLCLYDTLGNIITDATVKCGARTLKFDKTTQTYNTRKVKDGQVLEVNNKGVYHYLEVDKDGRYYSVAKKNIFKSAWWSTKRFWHNLKSEVKCIFNPDLREKKDWYTGFVVFSKPKYKPGERVKLKVYMADHSGKPYNKPLDVRLSNYYPTRIDTLLTNLKPYRPGMYEYEFDLSEGLNLKLDVDYTIELRKEKEDHSSFTGTFRYEDYELKGIRFSMDTDKEEYSKRDSVKIKFDVKDINEMAVYDGQIDLLVLAEKLFYYKTTDLSSGFVPDTLWRHTLTLDGTLKREVVLPDSIFPAGIAFDYRVLATYLSADNEKKTAQKKLSRKIQDYIIDFSVNKGMLTITQLHEGVSQEVMAGISVDTENSEIIQTKSVTLPHTMPLPWFADDITVKTSKVTDYYSVADASDKEQMGCQLYRMKDSIYLKVDNPADIPFWYTVNRNNKEIAHGYTTQLSYTAKDNKQGYKVLLSYHLGGHSKVIEKSLPFIEKNISMDISTPTSVYPGQKAEVLINVKDKKGKPVSDVDITAYSFTSKFGNYYMPAIAIHGKGKYARNFKTVNYDADEKSLYNRKVNMTWNRWKGIMALDTIEYYKFLYPETYYVYTEPTEDKATLVSPYVIVDGAMQQVHMLMIDERLYYTSAAEQPDIYSFPVEPGNHNFKFRTFDREISIHNVYIKKGERNIISFNVAPPYQKLASMHPESDASLVISSRLLKKEERSFPTDSEKNYLTDQLISMDSNFGTIRLPNLTKTIDIPAYVKSGDSYYYINHSSKQIYNPTLREFINRPVILGPFPKRSVVNGIGNIASVYRDSNELITLIELEGGNKYAVYPGYQKIKGWDALPFHKNTRAVTQVKNFRATPYSVNSILQHSKENLLSLLRSSTGPAQEEKKFQSRNYTPARLTLHLNKDVNGKTLTPALIFIVPEDKQSIGKYQLYYGGTRNFTGLPLGNMKVSLVFNDSTSYTQSITLYKGGQNFLKIDSISFDDNGKEIAANAFKIFNRGITKKYPRNPYFEKNAKDSIVMLGKQDPAKYRKSIGLTGVVSGVVSDNSGYPVIGASVHIPGTTIGTITDIDGYFELTGGTSGDKIEVSYIGYISHVFDYTEGRYYDIKIQEDHQALEEVVVVGYGVQKKYDVTGSVVDIDESGILYSIDERANDIRIRGRSDTGGGSPLILVNGLPFSGNINEIDPSNILSFNVLKDASATAIYGSQAANGVIMIQTNAIGMNLPQEQTDNSIPMMESGNTMRRNFHDDAFWQPRLRTNEKGEASFEVTYPDDVTSWDAYFIAVGDKRQSDKQKMTIKSFKALAASLSTPRFAVRGDSLNAVGKITNHMGDSISVSRTIEIDGQQREDNIRLKNSHIDYIPLTAATGDSLTIAYSMQLGNGYFDGEERSFPIIEQGVQQSHGEFKLLNDTATYTFTPTSGLGTVTVHAEASSLELFLKEIEKVDAYPYMCNEQMASKIKVLLSKKRIAGMFDIKFNDDKKIKNLIDRLNNNQNSEGKWGWWNKDKTEFWISRQVVSALLDAEEAGFTSGLDRNELRSALIRELKSGISSLQLTTSDRVPLAKQELLSRLIMLKQLHAPIEYDDYLEQIHTQLPSRNITDRLKTMEARAVIGQKDEINMDSLMYYSHKTMLGSMFWGDAEERPFFYGRFLLPFNNNTDNTLIAYKILKEVGGYEKEMEQVRNFFFERRQGGSWANTYESSRIIETIMPDMLSPGQSFEEVAMTMNDRKITKFPFTEELNTTAPIHIRKDGTMPVFVTAYQQAWNSSPEPETTKGFKVKSVFTVNSDTISNLVAGKTARLQVLVIVDADAEYIQIEVPIPAGCSYETKRAGNYWNEVHREHFKDKVVIFSNRLAKGQHTFTVDVLPRFTGRYSLNPAKVELMYFPIFYGNEGMKTVDIE